MHLLLDLKALLTPVVVVCRDLTGEGRERVMNSVKVTECSGARHAFGFCVQGVGPFSLPLACAL